MHHQMPPFVSKTTKSAGSISQAMHCSPCLADPHAPRIHIRATLSYVSTAPPYSHQAPKISTLVSTRPAFQFHKSQPTPTSKHPEPALHLRKPNAGQFQQITHACDWGGGCRHLLHGYAHTCTYGHAHTFMGTRTAMVMRARSLTCTAIVIPSRACARPRQRPGTLLTRPAYGSHGSSANPVHSNALRLRNTSADLRVQPAYSKRLGGMGVNGDGVDVDDRGGRCVCVIGLSGLRARLQSSLKAGQA